jgi:hypothetical protein
MIKKEEIEKDETIIEDNNLLKSFWQIGVLVVSIRVYTNWSFVLLVWCEPYYEWSCSKIILLL